MESSLLERAIDIVRLPDSLDRRPELVGDGLRCPITGRVFAVRDGVLDLLGADGPRTVSQRALDTRITTWIYDRGRNAFLAAAGLPPFAVEIGLMQHQLALAAGDSILDIACGPGNFTVEWARLVGPSGLVLGLDISRSMLARAAARLAGLGLGNVLLIRGDAHRLPMADQSLSKVNCSGGFHQLPDLPRALAEISRVSRHGAALTASMFAESPEHRRPRLRRWLIERLGLNLVPLDWLGGQLESVGFERYIWSSPRGAFSYTSATKRR